jgi:hypothetical protein
MGVLRISKPNNKGTKCLFPTQGTAAVKVVGKCGRCVRTAVRRAAERQPEHDPEKWGPVFEKIMLKQKREPQTCAARLRDR